MKHLFLYAKKYRAQCILGPLFKLMEAALELCVPLVVKLIIDVGIANADTSYIIKMSLLLVGFGAAGLGLAVVAQYFSAAAAVGVTSSLRQALMAKIQTFSYSDLDKTGNSTIIIRMTQDCNQVQTGINLFLRLLLRSPFVVFGAMIMAFTIDAQSALTFVVVIPVLAIVIFAIMLACLPLYGKVQKKLDCVMRKTRENLSGVRVIRAFGREEAEKSEYEADCESLQKSQNKVGVIAALLNPLTYALINLAVIALIMVGANRVDSGIITQGAVIALYNYMAQILVELIKLANLIINVTKSIACAKRIGNVLDREPAQKNGAIQSGKYGVFGEVTFKNASLRYDEGAGNAVEGLDFTATKGETVGIIGGTGSGKSSLVSLIPRLYDATGGCVEVDGVNVNDYDMNVLRKKIGVVPQKAALFSGTLRENLLWGNDGADEQTLKEAVAAACADFVYDKEGGLDCVVEQGGRNFSGGQRQRLTIARALVRKPEILILDDSSSALDFATDAALRKNIADLPYKPTVFVVSQRTGSVHSADKIVVLDNGKVVGLGKHDELLQACEVYKEIHSSQFKKEDEQK